MSTRRKSRLLSPETKLAAVIVAGFMAYTFWFFWIGIQSADYRACLSSYHRIRAAPLLCSFHLPGGGLADYLVFAAQWLPLVIVVGWIWRAVRQPRKRPSRTNRKSVSFSKIPSE